jgi:Mg-chelatase subunit ChlD
MQTCGISLRFVGPLLLIALLAAAGGRSSAAGGPDPSPELSVRITSPLGRTNIQGGIRIVAQVHDTRGAGVLAVRFLVDNVLVGEDSAGPPWSVDWNDENPFEPREIVAEVSDDAGHTARDAVTLKPFEVLQKAEVTSVLLESSVIDPRGQYVTGLGPGSFRVEEDGVPQRIEVVRPETMPATYILLVDSSQSMARRIDFVRLAAARLMTHLRPVDRIIVAPFSRTISAITGPTSDRATVLDAITAIQPRGGTAISDCLEQVSAMAAGIEGRTVVVLITDGYDEHSSKPVSQSLTDAERSGVTVYVVGIGGVAGISIRGEQLLRRIATETGGRGFFPPS